MGQDEGEERVVEAGRGSLEERELEDDGEVAAYFAECAREVQEVARKEQLEGARLMVEAKRFFLFLLFCGRD